MGWHCSIEVSLLSILFTLQTLNEEMEKQAEAEVVPSSSLVEDEVEVEVGVEVEKFKGRVHYFSGVDGWCGRIENKAISAFN